jgi:UDP-N-acetylglucosamine 2-epimerase (non-hydrolysing)
MKCRSAENRIQSYEEEMKKVLTVFGTRPEGIKLAPLIKTIDDRNIPLQSVVCVTGQHREMMQQVLDVFGIEPEYNLDIMKKDQSLYDVSARAIEGLEAVLKDVRPDLVLVQGDTTTAFIAGLAAFYAQMGLGHVEAGLRTGDKFNPFPEEMNRVLIGYLADLHFSPTAGARDNLLREGVEEKKIFITGNTGIDALLMTSRSLQNEEKRGIFSRYFLDNYGLSFDKRSLLVTMQRRESFGMEMENICQGIKEIASKYQDVKIIFPVHPNPNVRRPVAAILENLPNVFLIPPLDYPSLVFLMTKVKLILTDSGGIQEEAPSLGKPVLVMRKTTERPEGIEAGTAILVGTDKERIIEETSRLLDDSDAYEAMARAVNPYGDGKASERIVGIILDELKR